MKVVVIVRTLNEADNIGKFCLSYVDADKILVSDGGSTDDTVSIAEKFNNVEVLHFNKRIELQNGYWVNKVASGINFLIGHANKHHPDWIIFDDCDCRPNALLKKDYREMLERNNYSDFVMAVRLYLWGNDQHFPDLAKPYDNHTRYGAGLWAWRGNQKLWANDAFPHFTFRLGNTVIKDFAKDAACHDLMPPYCLLHCPWPTEQKVEEKLKFYRDSGLIPLMQHPLNFGGHLEPLPDWAKE